MTPIRQYALDFLERATNGAKGVARGDAPYERVTEGRHTAAVKAGLFYSACGDLAQALLFACGIRDKRFINRAENGKVSGDPYKVGWNVVELNALAQAQRNWTKLPAVAGDILELEPGDITIVWNRADTTDAHVAVARERPRVALDRPIARDVLATSDYGQGAPLDGKQCARTVLGNSIGSRKLQRIINLEEAVARYATAAPIPVADYFAIKGPLKRPTLRQGSSGEAVKDLQALLNQNQLMAGWARLKVDGDFGPKTDAAVEEFQRVYGLTVDGVVGPKTWAALEA